MALDPDIPHQDTTYKVIGAAMRIHTRLGPGLKERHYQHALSKELQSSGLTASEEPPVEIFDRDRWLGRLYLDLLVENCVVVETKAFSHLLTKQEEAQVVCYLAATGAKVGLLLNFGRRRLDYQRILPPRVLDGWQDKIGRFLWKPGEPDR